jgi:hypothetical protein
VRHVLRPAPLQYAGERHLSDRLPAVIAEPAQCELGFGTYPLQAINHGEGRLSELRLAHLVWTQDRFAPHKRFEQLRRMTTAIQYHPNQYRASHGRVPSGR